MEVNELEHVDVWVSVKDLILCNKLFTGPLPLLLNIKINFNVTDKFAKLYYILNAELAVITVNDSEYRVLSTKSIYIERPMYFKEDVEALANKGLIKYVEQTKLFKDAE